MATNPFLNSITESGHAFSREAIEGTPLYQKGVLRLTEDAPGVYGVLNTITGKRYNAVDSSLSEVIAEASQLGIAEFDEIKGVTRGDVLAGRALDQSEYGRLSDLKKIIDENVLDASSGTFGEDIRRIAGLTDDVLGKQLIIERIGFEKAKDLGKKDSLQAIIRSIAAAQGLPEEELPGILNIQKDASVLLRFRVGDQYLTEDQIQKILVRTGSAVLDPKKIVQGLDVSDGEDILAKIGTDFTKASKRVKAHTSARNVTFKQEDVSGLIEYINETLKPRNKISTLDDAVLIYDTSLESVLKTFGVQEQYTQAAVNALPDLLPDGSRNLEKIALQRRRSGIGIVTESFTQDVGQNFFTQELRRVGVPDTEVSGVLSFLQDALAGDDGFITRSIKSGNVNDISVKSIVDYLESASESAGIIKGQMTGVREVFTEALKKTQDGSMFMSTVVNKYKAEQIQDVLLELRQTLDTLSPGDDVARKLHQQNISKLEDEFSRIASGDPILRQSDRSL